MLRTPTAEAVPSSTTQPSEKRPYHGICRPASRQSPGQRGGDDRPHCPHKDTHQRLARAHLPQRGACRVPRGGGRPYGSDQLPPRTRRSHAQDRNEPGAGDPRHADRFARRDEAHRGGGAASGVVCRQPRLAARDLRNGECRLSRRTSRRIDPAYPRRRGADRHGRAPQGPHRPIRNTGQATLPSEIRRTAPPLRRRRHVARPAQAVSGHLCRSDVQIRAGARHRRFGGAPHHHARVLPADHRPAAGSAGEHRRAAPSRRAEAEGCRAAQTTGAAGAHRIRTDRHAPGAEERRTEPHRGRAEECEGRAEGCQVKKRRGGGRVEHSRRNRGDDRHLPRQAAAAGDRPPQRGERRPARTDRNAEPCQPRGEGPA